MSSLQKKSSWKINYRNKIQKPFDSGHIIAHYLNVAFVIVKLLRLFRACSNPYLCHGSVKAHYIVHKKKIGSFKTENARDIEFWVNYACH